MKQSSASGGSGTSGGSAGGGTGGSDSASTAIAGAGGSPASAMGGVRGMLSGGAGGSGVDAGLGTGTGKAFDAGAAPGLNAVKPGEICERAGTILCAGEAACCSNPGRDFMTCLATFEKNCKEKFMFDEIAMQTTPAFDAKQAEMVFTQLENMASMCDPSIKQYSQSSSGLSTIFKGSIGPLGSCLPSNPLDPAMAAGALASCAMNQAYACLPTIWQCVERGDRGGSCFTDANCKVGLYCDNPDLTVNTTSTCMARKAVGASCTAINECESWLCRNGKCVALDKQTAFCP